MIVSIKAGKHCLVFKAYSYYIMIAIISPCSCYWRESDEQEINIVKLKIIIIIIATPRAYLKDIHRHVRAGPIIRYAKCSPCSAQLKMQVRVLQQQKNLSPSLSRGEAHASWSGCCRSCSRLAAAAGGRRGGGDGGRRLPHPPPGCWPW